jgi:hypothetical protein
MFDLLEPEEVWDNMGFVQKLRIGDAESSTAL